MSVVELLAPQPGERILDLGCGDGILTINLSNRGCDVVGVDLCPAMIAAARSLGANAHAIDGHRLPFVSHYDGLSCRIPPPPTTSFYHWRCMGSLP
ncbi:MAG: class I SAM-dependent methyltransferase [Nitrospira sp.]|nr:class I SAM-dependent methyltransferase [Nitrospira sp.]